MKEISQVLFLSKKPLSTGCFSRTKIMKLQAKRCEFIKEVAWNFSRNTLLTYIHSGEFTQAQRRGYKKFAPSPHFSLICKCRVERPLEFKLGFSLGAYNFCNYKIIFLRFFLHFHTIFLNFLPVFRPFLLHFFQRFFLQFFTIFPFFYDF